MTIATGFLGAGKTTLVNHLLASRPDRRIAVLVNDFGEVNIDARLIAGATGDVVALTNGCICCSMKNDVVRAVFRVLEDPSAPEHLLVEASGVSNPGALAEIFLALEKNRVLRLDGIVAVVDAERFPYGALKSEPLARDQVLASDLVVINKIDLVTAEERAKIEAAIRARVPAARLVFAEHARVSADLVLGLGGAKGNTDGPTHDADDFETFTFEAGELDFKKLVEIIESFPPQVVRVKGILSIAERRGDRIALNVVGRRVHVETLGSSETASSQIVVIGTRGGFDADDLSRRLRACVVH